MTTEILTAVAPGLIYRKSLGTSANRKQKYVSVYETIDPLNNNKKYKVEIREFNIILDPLGTQDLSLEPNIDYGVELNAEEFFKLVLVFSECESQVFSTHIEPNILPLMRMVICRNNRPFYVNVMKYKDQIPDGYINFNYEEYTSILSYSIKIIQLIREAIPQQPQPPVTTTRHSIDRR